MIDEKNKLKRMAEIANNAAQPFIDDAMWRKEVASTLVTFFVSEGDSLVEEDYTHALHSRANMGLQCKDPSGCVRAVLTAIKEVV